MTNVSFIEFLYDFGMISALLVLAHFLRSHFKLLQMLFIPSSVIAGLLALFLGGQFFNVLSFSLDHDGLPNISSYPAFLVVILFSTVFLGKRKKEISIKNTIEHAGDTLFFNLATILGQYGFSLLFGLLFLYPFFPELHNGFSLLLPAGFVGGHGTAAAIGSVLEEHGLKGAQSLGYASATVGILVGIVGGMILINIATRLGWTRLIKSGKDMPVSMKTGFVPEKEQGSMGKETISPIALDPLSWHIALVFLVSALAYKFAFFVQSFLALSVPTFCLALLLGALVQKILNICKVGQYVDRHTIHRLGSTATDFLVAFAVSSISVHVVFAYAMPLALLFAFGSFLTVCFVWFLGRRICRNFWFERSMLMFGWNTGTVAMSMVLVRVLDPDMHSGVLEDFGISYFGIALVEIALISLLPPVIAKGFFIVPLIVLFSSFFLCIFLSKQLVGWFSASPTLIREGEAQIMGGDYADS